MTRDELLQELPRLSAFAKIALLDRALAHLRVAEWLMAAPVGPSLHWFSRIDAYRSLAMLAAGEPVQPDADDCLANPILRELGVRERTWHFLTGHVGFSDEVADEIVNGLPVYVAPSGAPASASEEQTLSLGSRPDIRMLRLAG